jgi:DedD protein
MDLRLKHRLVGAVVLIAIGVIFIPMLLDGPPMAPDPVTLERIPPQPGEDYVPRRIDLTLPPRDQAPVAPPAATPEPTTSAPADAPATGPAGGWAIQLGSFSKPENARALRDRLRKEGYIAFDEAIAGPDGKTTTRVRIGPELDRAVLERQLARLQKDPAFAAAIILRHP